MSDSTVSKDTIEIERIFNAPPEIIWQMWTQPEHFQSWYGPTGFTVPVAEMDVRVGGKRVVCMQSPDGNMKIWFTGEYIEVSPYERLVYSDSFMDEDGNVATPATYGMSDDDTPVITYVTVQLQDLGGRTKMMMTHSVVSTEEQGAVEGWTQSFAKLADHVETVLKAN